MNLIYTILDINNNILDEFIIGLRNLTKEQAIELINFNHKVLTNKTMGVKLATNVEYDKDNLILRWTYTDSIIKHKLTYE